MAKLNKHYLDRRIIAAYENRQLPAFAEEKALRKRVKILRMQGLEDYHIEASLLQDLRNRFPNLTFGELRQIIREYLAGIK
jgi:hypothetical protein